MKTSNLPPLFFLALSLWAGFWACGGSENLESSASPTSTLDFELNPGDVEYHILATYLAESCRLENPPTNSEEIEPTIAACLETYGYLVEWKPEIESRLVRAIKLLSQQHPEASTYFNALLAVLAPAAQPTL